MSTEQRLQELEDRIATRELIDAYPICADIRNIQGHMGLFTEDMNFEVYMDENANADPGSHRQEESERGSGNSNYILPGLSLKTSRWRTEANDRRYPVL